MDDRHATGPVVAGVVEAQGQEQVALRAAEEATRAGTGLRLMHAVERPLPAGSTAAGADGGTHADRAERVIAPLAAAVHRKFPDLAVEPDVVSGLPAPALVDRSAGASLIVVGHRGTGGLPRLPLGSVSLQVATHSRCPVLVIRPRKGAEPEVERVVVGVDVDDMQPHVMEFALRAAAARDAPLDVVHGSTRPDLLGTGPTGPLLVAREKRPSAAKDLLEERLGPYRSRCHDLDIRTRVERTRPAHLLVDSSRDATLLVVGTHGRTGLRRLMLGSVSGEVLHTARCPVVVVPPPEAEE
ncbi:universal stress protein [Streptomyces sp. WMMC940]|uniref:universal stress protein n=1 Tax=Streptomyces sp. WMMC940 TaxID=3015153 RepID=UPI0022B6F6DB|nr:universal stress protein [Streptomyces sp. WMMC940]MCZ7461949.1 universal stress protein [Streptomyces sp. WMMC940]